MSPRTCPGDGGCGGSDVAWLLVWGGLSSAWCLTAARELSATFDEPFYLRAGLTSWRTGSNYELMRAGTMPLPVDVQYLPDLLVGTVPRRAVRCRRPDDFHTILPYSRAMNLVFWWLLLVYGMLVGRLFGGPWAGRFAVVLIATEPSLLGPRVPGDDRHLRDGAWCSPSRTTITAGGTAAAWRSLARARPAVRPGHDGQGLGPDVRPSLHGGVRSAAAGTRPVPSTGRLATAGSATSGGPPPVRWDCLEGARRRDGRRLGLLRDRLDDRSRRS